VIVWVVRPGFATTAFWRSRKDFTRWLADRRFNLTFPQGDLISNTEENGRGHLLVVPFSVGVLRFLLYRWRIVAEF